jgi:hypothetical protein
VHNADHVQIERSASMQSYIPGIDLIREASIMNLIKEIGFPTYKILFAGEANGRNIWDNDLVVSLSVLKPVRA